MRLDIICVNSYRLEEVARSICSSKAEFEVNQLVIMVDVKGYQPPAKHAKNQGGRMKV